MIDNRVCLYYICKCFSDKSTWAASRIHPCCGTFNYGYLKVGLKAGGSWSVFPLWNIELKHRAVARYIPEKSRGSWGHTILRKFLEFLGILYPPKFLTKQRKVHPLDWKFHKNVLHPFGNSKTKKTKTPGNSTLFCPDHSLKFNFVSSGAALNNFQCFF